MARILNSALISFVLLVCFAGVACAEPMPIRATYMPVNASCDDGRPLYRPDDAFDLNAPPAALDWEELLRDELGLPEEFTGDEPEAHAGMLSGAMFTPAAPAGALRLASYGAQDANPDAAKKPAKRKKAAASKAQITGVVNINTATVEQLVLLPGVGPALAGRIVEYRERRKFTEAAHLRRVKGIGRAKFEKMKDHVIVEGETTIKRG